jgi:hypothetical protein
MGTVLLPSAAKWRRNEIHRVVTGANFNDFNGRPQTTNLGCVIRISAAETDATHLQHSGVSH